LCTLRWLPLIPLLLLLAPSPARALDDVVIDRLGAVDPAARQGEFEFVVRELSMALAAPPNHAVGALGLYELEVTTEHRMAFLHVDPAGPGGSAWGDVVQDADAGTLAWSPGLQIRKGLPWSFEAGGSAAWMAVTRQFKIGGYGRWAFLGGWDKVPDVALRLGYDGYVGNPQLELGVFKLDLAVGYTFKASSKAERAGTRFSPFGGYGYLMSHARAVSDVGELTEVTAWADKAKTGVDPRDFRFHRFFAGMEIRTSQVVFRFGADLTVPRNGPLMAAMNLSLGARF